MSKTVYIDEKKEKTDNTAKIYERFMNDPSEKLLTTKTDTHAINTIDNEVNADTPSNEEIETS